MAGGVGARFWPSSTPDYPKQFIDMLGNGSSLLQTTFSRLEKIVPTENIYIVTQLRYQKIILGQLGGKLNEDQTPLLAFFLPVSKFKNVIRTPK